MDESRSKHFSLLEDKEINALKEGCVKGCSLKELRDHAHRMNMLEEKKDKKDVNVEIDMLLVLRLTYKFSKRTYIKPKEMFYVLAFLLDETTHLNMKEWEVESPRKMKKMGLRFIRLFKTVGKNAYSAFPLMIKWKNSADYWWDYACEIYDK